MIDARLEKIGLTFMGGALFSVGLAAVSVANRFLQPATVTVIRMVMAVAVMGVLLAALRLRVPLDRRSLGDMAALGLLNIGLPFFTVGVALQHISSTLAAILYNTTPFFTLLIAHWLLPDEKLNRVKIIGTVSVVAGATLLVASNSSGLTSEGSQGWLGQLLVLGGALASAVGVIVSRKRLPGQNTFSITTGQVAWSLVFLVPVALFTDGLPRLELPGYVWALLVASTFTGPVISFWLFFYTVKKYSASLAGFSTITTPFFTVLIGWLFLGEVLTLPIVAGAALVLAGVWSLQYF